ncbi:hypothetical protein C8J56DRAFT_1116507 [Mycena floridula]|nr:hypothetical protein C8J56DRAFT_1116507 [Mycena floridula]
MSTEHQGVRRLAEIIKDGNTYCSGAVTVPTEGLGLYYRTSNKEENARFIDLSNASDASLEALSQACQPASFGRGDESYCKAGKLDSTQFSLPFDLQKSGIMEHVVAILLQEGKGSFFKPHKDTPRGDDMIGSLVIDFSTVHEGGNLVLRHKEQEYIFDSIKESNEPEVSSIYLPLKAALQELYTDSSFLPDGGILGWGLQYSYPYLQSSEISNLRSVLKVLKGGDSSLYRASLYECDDESQILASSFPDLDYTDKEELVAVRLVEHRGGLLIFMGGDFEYSEEEVEEVKVTWVTPCTKFNRAETVFAAFLSEGTDYMYGDLCMILKIPSFSSRVVQQ